MVDTGTHISQISLKASTQLWSALTPISTEKALCKGITNNSRVDLQRDLGFRDYNGHRLSSLESCASGPYDQ